MAKLGNHDVLRTSRALNPRPRKLRIYNLVLLKAISQSSILYLVQKHLHVQLSPSHLSALYNLVHFLYTKTPTFQFSCLPCSLPTKQMVPHPVEDTKMSMIQEIAVGLFFTVSFLTDREDVSLESILDIPKRVVLVN
jgi:hypothetical protein